MKRKDYAWSVGVFLVLSVILTGMLLLVEKKSIMDKQDRHLYIASTQANIMKDSINTAIGRVYTFSALIRNNKGNTDFFDTEAEVIYKEIVIDSGIPIRNVAIAPGGVVERVYPLEGNEQLVGFDFMEPDREGNEAAIEAYERGDVVITNPFSLVQGGKGMAGRLPVFVTEDGSARFWGLVTVTLDFDKMIRNFQLGNLSKQHLNYNLWYEDDNGSSVSLAASEEMPVDPVTYDFDIQNLNWHLDVEPSAGWQNRMLILVAMIGILGFSLVLGVLLLDKSRIKYANAQLECMANRDSLTGCYSRNYINTYLINAETGEWNDPNLRYSLAIVDIDCFKNVNDTYGHGTGDRSIIAISKVLTACTSHAHGDCVFRYGGDEFIVLWNDMTRERLTEKMAEIIEKVHRISFTEYPEMHFSVSVGGCLYNGETYFTMNKQADEKLYEAKENGKDQYAV